MSRALDTLQKIKSEIQNDPNGRGYALKTAAEIAILMNQDYSYSPKQFTTVVLDALDVIRNKATSLQIDTLKDFAITQGIISLGDLSLSVEQFRKRSDELSLGEVSQGDIEEALRT